MKQTVGVRVEKDLVNEIKVLVEAGEYKDVSEFIREAILEKLHPNYIEERRQRKLSAILTDPDIPDDIKKVIRQRQSS